MSSPDTIAARLLDAQVAWAIDEVTGPGLPDLLAADVDELLGYAAGHTLAEVADPEAVKHTARVIAAAIGSGELVGELVPAFAGTVHELPTAADHTLGEVVDRADVEALVAKVLSMHRLHDRLLERMVDSPLVGTVASKFVTKIVADFVQQNRERAEKVPGMGSLLSLGSGAVSRVRNVTDKHVDALLGDAAGKGAQYAIRRTNSAIRELIRDAPVQGAVLEVWDLHAEEPVGELRAYLSARDVRELAALIFNLVADAAGSVLVGGAGGAGVEELFARYGSSDVASLLLQLGLTRDDLVQALVAHARPLLNALHASGELDALVRARLAPFFQTPQALAIIAGEQPANAAPAKKPAKKSARPSPKKA